MYGLFVRNVSGFLRHVSNESQRSYFEPISLIADKKMFSTHKEQGTDVYNNLEMILSKANSIKNTKKYHRFGNFLREIELEGFTVNLDVEANQIDADIIDEQISFLWQCMFFNYVIDE